MTKGNMGFWRIGVVMLLAVFLTGAVSSAAPSNNVDTSKPMQLSLAEAKKKALADNPRMELAEVGVKKAQFGITKARRNVDNIDDLRSGSGGMAGYDFTTSLGRAIAIPKAESDLRVAKKELEFKRAELEKEVEDTYYSLLKAEAELEIAKKKLESAEKQLAHAKTSYELGMIAKNDLLMAEIGVANAKAGLAGLTAAENKYEEARMKLAKQMAMPIETKFVLTSRFDMQPKEIDVKKAVASALENNMNVFKAKEGLEVLKARFEFAGRYYTPNVYEYRDAEYEYKEMQISFQTIQDSVEVAVETMYLSIAGFPQQYQLLAKAKNHAEENLRLTQLRYESGLATTKDVLDAIVKLSEAEVDLNKAVYGYNILLAEYKLITGLDF